MLLAANFHEIFFEMDYFRIIFFTIYINKILAIRSGLYVDNGHGQTAIEESLTMSEKLQFEREMLNMFGITRKPRITYNSTDIQTSSSKYLLAAYKIIKKSAPPDQFNLGHEDIISIQKSDAILTFAPRIHQIEGSRNNKGRKLHFDLKADVPDKHSIAKAELRLYKHYIGVNYNVIYVVKIHIILDYDDGRELELIEELDVKLDQKGWITFNITDSLYSWIAMPSTNHGFKLSVFEKTEGSRKGKKVSPDDIGLITNSSQANLEPFIAVYLNFINGFKARKVRGITRRRPFDESLFTPVSTSTWRLCQQQVLYVDFNDLNWDNWIIAPNGYSAFYCYGTCEFPMEDASDNSTSIHAVMQTLMNLMNPEKVPPACCVPTEYAPLSVIYYLDDGKVILKTFPGMVVAKCGCR